MATNRRCQTNAPPSLVISMAMRIRRYDAERIAQYGRSRATLDATICRHRSSIRPVSPRRTRSRHAIPRPFQPKPRRPTFDCRVVHDCDRADWKMYVRCTAHKKRGLVAASKRMMAEGMTLRAATSELRVTPPPPKI